MADVNYSCLFYRSETLDDGSSSVDLTLCNAMPYSDLHIQHRSIVLTSNAIRKITSRRAIQLTPAIIQSGVCGRGVGVGVRVCVAVHGSACLNLYE